MHGCADHRTHASRTTLGLRGKVGIVLKIGGHNCSVIINDETRGALVAGGPAAGGCCGACVIEYERGAVAMGDQPLRKPKCARTFLEDLAREVFTAHFRFCHEPPQCVEPVEPPACTAFFDGKLRHIAEGPHSSNWSTVDSLRNRQALEDTSIDELDDVEAFGVRTGVELLHL